jgi:hypothetical protein
MVGRRVKSMAEIERPGDYFGPTMDYTNDRPAVFFLLPNARDEGARGSQRSVHHVCSPPHVFRECSDGSLEIRESILTTHNNADPTRSWSWHGYLDEGHNWREV